MKTDMSGNSNEADGKFISSLHIPDSYEIRVKGHLDEGWTDWLDGLTITELEGGEIIMSGPIVDQSAFDGLIANINRMGLTLVAIKKNI